MVRRAWYALPQLEMRRLCCCRVYTPPTREVMVEVWNCTAVPGAANNITSGDAPAGSGGCMYRSPTIEYLWPENVPGTPIVANNFESACPRILCNAPLAGLAPREHCKSARSLPCSVARVRAVMGLQGISSSAATCQLSLPNAAASHPRKPADFMPRSPAVPEPEPAPCHPQHCRQGAVMLHPP